MAFYFHNKLVLAIDYLKISNRYSSPQSFWRAKKKGFIQPVSIGGLQFMEATPGQVDTLYDTGGLNDFATISPTKNLTGIVLLGSAAKSAGVNEAKVLIWAITQRLDVYWIAGKLFTDLQQVLHMAAAEKARIAVTQTLKPKAKLRKRRR